MGRQPRVSIAGPRSVAIQEALGHKQAKYSAALDDLRDGSGTRLRAEWSGAAQGTGESKTIDFRSAGQPRLRVTVRDSDGLSASDEITITVTIIPLEDGQQPF